LADNGVSDNKNLAGHQVGLAYFSYITNNLKGTITRIIQAGFPINNEGTPNECRENIYFLDGYGYEVEFFQYHTDVPKLRNRY